ncbi:MAG: hypothetical protein J5658_03915 [Prevotella sp.]|nr:hypothetical protein [Prevotella sp.]
MAKTSNSFNNNTPVIDRAAYKAGELRVLCELWNDRHHEEHWVVTVDEGDKWVHVVETHFAKWIDGDFLSQIANLAQIYKWSWSLRQTDFGIEIDF